MDFLKTFGDNLGGILTAGASLLGTGWQIAFERDMMRESWRREDTAIQRRVADLKAAGLSPVLAAGSAASTMAPIRSEARQDMASKAVQAFLLAKEIQQRNEQIATTQTQRALMQAQKTNAMLTGLKIAQQTKEASLKNEQLSYMNQWYKEHPYLPYGQKLDGKTLLPALLAGIVAPPQDPEKMSERRKKLEEEKKKWEEQDKKWYLDYLHEGE